MRRVASIAGVFILIVALLFAVWLWIRPGRGNDR